MKRTEYAVLKLTCGSVVGFFIGLGIVMREQMESAGPIVLVLAACAVVTALATLWLGAPLLKVIAALASPFWIKR